MNLFLEDYKALKTKYMAKRDFTKYQNETLPQNLNFIYFIVSNVHNSYNYSIINKNRKQKTNYFLCKGSKRKRKKSTVKIN